MIVTQPSRTAMRVALRRAAHQLVDERPLIFKDPFAVSILGPEATLDLERTPKALRRPFSAALRAWVVARARFAEDLLAPGMLSQGVGQYLILGAGLDTFALRNPHPDLAVFEVDHPATQAWKRERLQANGHRLPPNASLVPVDFERESLPEKLLHAGFDPAVPTITAALGVVPYLTSEAFADTCRFLARFPSGSGVVFDYSQPREALPAVERLMHDSLSARVAQAGEPFQLFFTPNTLQETLLRFRLAVIDDLGHAEINALYFDSRCDGLAVRGSGGRLCHVQAIAKC